MRLLARWRARAAAGLPYARTDGLVSLPVVASAAVVALGFPVGDPLIGLVITVVILRTTWQSYGTIRADSGHRPAQDDEHQHEHP